MTRRPTAPRNGRRSASSSGCHCTPTTKRAAGSSDRLGQPVGRPCRHHEPRPQPVEGLMVRAPDRRLVSPMIFATTEPGLGRDLDVGETSPGGLVSVVTHDVGHVLDEGAAQVDVEQLHSPADGENGQVDAESGTAATPARWRRARGRRRRWPGPAPARTGRGRRPRRPRARARRALPRALDATTSSSTALVGRGQQHGAPPRGGDGVDVGRGQNGRQPVPRAPRGPLVVRRDPHDGRRCDWPCDQYHTAACTPRPLARRAAARPVGAPPVPGMVVP